MPLPEQLQELERRIAATVEQALAAQRGELASRLRRRESELQELIDSVVIAAPRLSAADLAPFADEGAATGRARAFTALRDAMSRLDAARTQADLLAGLLEGACAFAARSALLLAREDGLHAWAGCGFGGDGVVAIEGVTVAYADAWAAAGSGRGTASLDRADCARLVDHLNGPSAHDGVAIPIVLRDRVAAVVYADRLTGGELAIAALQCLTYTATQALETLPLRPGQAASLGWATEAPAGSALRPWDTTAVATAAALAAAPAEPVPAAAEFDSQPEAEPAPTAALARPEPVDTAVEPEPEVAAEAFAEVPREPEATPAAGWESDWQLAAAPPADLEAAAELSVADVFAEPEPEPPSPFVEDVAVAAETGAGEEPTGSWQRAYSSPPVAEEPLATAADAGHEPQWTLEATPEEPAFVVTEEESAVEIVEAPATEIWPTPPTSFDSYEPTYEPTVDATAEPLPALIAEPAPAAEAQPTVWPEYPAAPELPPVGAYDEVVPTPAVSAEDDRLWAPVAAAQEPLATSWAEPVADTFVEPSAEAVYAEGYVEAYADAELPVAEAYSEPAVGPSGGVAAEVVHAEPAWQEPSPGAAADEAPAEELYAEVEDVTTTADIAPVAPADTHEDATVLITRPRFDRPEPAPSPELAYTERIPVGDLRSAVAPPAADVSPNATQMFARPPIEPPVVPPPEPSALVSPAPPVVAAPAVAAPRPATQVTPPAPKGDTVEVRPPEDLQGPGWAFATTRVQTVGRDPAHEEARRLARLLVSEIKLYNEELVEEGRRMRNIYGLLREDIDRSRQMYEERIDDRVRTESDYFQQELVRILAGGDAAALGT